MAQAPFGTWDSPLTPDLITSATLRLSSPLTESGDVYWLEQRPSEGGRNVICKWSDEVITDITPEGFNVRSAVHEYGGGAYIVVEGTVYFSNFSDHRIYMQKPGQTPVALTEPGPFRYADFVLDKSRNRLIVIKEDHSLPGEEPLNSLEYVSLSGGHAQTLLAGSDFFSSPRLSPDGKLLTWLTWNHPHMPWEETKLWTANVCSDGSLANIQKIAGGDGESVFQPEWGTEGTLYFVSDKNGWWNLHASYSGLVEPILEMQAEFGVPQWVFGLSTYAVLSPGRLVCTFCKNGVWKLAELDVESRELKEIALPYQDFSYVRSGGETVVFIGGSPTDPAQVVRLDMNAVHHNQGKVSHEALKVLRKSTELIVDSGYVSLAEPVEFATTGGATAYALYYPPKNKNFEAPAGTQPPLIVKSHGGPTSACGSTLSLGIQYWTSRGFAVVDVNYGGSTGYGKAYRQRLHGKWGIVDVDDCESAALHMVKAGKADPKRLIISGGSAGGYTTLCALTFKKTFTCGASYYGISDLEALAKDTHKFESRYTDSLVGKYPQELKTYKERSPIEFPEKLNCPIIFFQGLEDKVVPPSQSEAMYDALRKKGIPCAYLTFEGEQHGFRKGETQRICLNAELSFYCQVLGIKRSDITDIEITNLVAEPA